MNKTLPPTDHAKVVTYANFRISWVWSFPLLALIAVGWFFWSEWKSNGPKIQIEFHEAPGIEANKTLLLYRGVAAGKVTDVRLDDRLGKALVTVRLKAFASPLAQAGTLYWIDQPVIGLAKTSGLSSIIQGNSIQARLGEGPRSVYFVGLEKTPLHPLQAPGLILRLTAEDIPSLEEGSSVIYRGITIGGVMRKEFDDAGSPCIVVGIQKEYEHLIRSSSRFWNSSSSIMHLGPGGLKMELFNLKALLVGAIEVDSFGATGDPVTNGTEFRLCANQGEARFEESGMMINLVAKEIPTIEVGSPLLYHGVIVGKVKKKTLDPNQGASLQLFVKKEFISTLRSNVRFWRLPATQVEVGPGTLKVGIASIKTLLEGGIAYDNFGSEGSEVKEGASFSLFANEQMARLSSRPLKMTFENGQGLLAGQTQIRYLGIPIGIVADVKAYHRKVEVTAYIQPGYDFLRKPEATYTIIRSKLSLDGISGIETLISGVYIECAPIKKKKSFVHFIDRLFKSPEKSQKN